jgi:hypothetical protein
MKSLRNTELPLYNTAVSFGLMAQLAMCLPSTVDVRYHILQMAPSRDSSQQGCSSLIFISGTRSAPADSKHNSKVIFCLYSGQDVEEETFDNEHRGLAIQLTPVFRVFGSGKGEDSLFEIDMGIYGVIRQGPTRTSSCLGLEEASNTKFGHGPKELIRIRKLGERSGPQNIEDEKTMVEEEVVLHEIKQLVFTGV